MLYTMQLRCNHNLNNYHNLLIDIVLSNFTGSVMLHCEHFAMKSLYIIHLLSDDYHSHFTVGVNLQSLWQYVSTLHYNLLMRLSSAPRILEHSRLKSVYEAFAFYNEGTFTLRINQMMMFTTPYNLLVCLSPLHRAFRCIHSFHSNCTLCIDYVILDFSTMPFNFVNLWHHTRHI